LGLRPARETEGETIRSTRIHLDCEDTMTWRKRPVIYEIAAWVWLDELRERYSQPLILATIPAQEWDALAALCVDAVWLMGVWQRSCPSRKLYPSVAMMQP
jgi:hypothetical protein